MSINRSMQFGDTAYFTVPGWVDGHMPRSSRSRDWLLLLRTKCVQLHGDETTDEIEWRWAARHTMAGMTASNSDLIRSAQLQCVDRESGCDHARPSDRYARQKPSPANSGMCVIASLRKESFWELSTTHLMHCLSASLISFPALFSWLWRVIVHTGWGVGVGDGGKRCEAPGRRFA